MSKLIVEMEMPKNCRECAFSTGCSFCEGYDDYCVLAPRDAEYEWNFSDGIEPSDRPSWCPIVGVLPDEHGDLIDRDVLYMAVKSHNTSDAAIARNHNRVTSLQNLSTIRKGYIAEKHICLDDIIRAEAVIKAERKDDGTTVD